MLKFSAWFLFDNCSISPQPVSVSSLPPVSVARDWMDWAAFLFSFALVVVGILGVRAAIRTLQAVEKQAALMVEQAGQMKEQTAIAKDAANAALMNARALINSERPWVMVEPSCSGHDEYLIILFKAVNRGRSPAEWLCKTINFDGIRAISGYDIRRYSRE